MDKGMSFTSLATIHHVPKQEKGRMHIYTEGE